MMPGPQDPKEYYEHLISVPRGQEGLGLEGIAQVTPFHQVRLWGQCRCLR